MKFITKNLEPQAFTDWKALANADWQPTYGGLQNPEKGTVHDSLLQEQGFICCYCGRRIGTSDSHIEHLVPQAVDPSLALDYGNMLGSCLRETKENDPLHCGHARGNDCLPVTPLQPDCESRFRFTNDGQIKPADDADDQAKTAIELLALDIDKLQAGRRDAIRLAFHGIDALAPAEKSSLRATFSERDSQGLFSEYCVPILYVLDNYY